MFVYQKGMVIYKSFVEPKHLAEMCADMSQICVFVFQQQTNAMFIYSHHHFSKYILANQNRLIRYGNRKN